MVDFYSNRTVRKENLEVVLPSKAALLFTFFSIIRFVMTLTKLKGSLFLVYPED